MLMLCLVASSSSDLILTTLQTCCRRRRVARRTAAPQPLRHAGETACRTRPGCVFHRRGALCLAGRLCRQLGQHRGINTNTKPRLVSIATYCYFGRTWPERRINNKLNRCTILSKVSVCGIPVEGGDATFSWMHARCGLQKKNE